MPWASKPFCDKLFNDEFCDQIMNQENDEFEPDVIPTYEDVVQHLDIFGGHELFRVGTDWYSRSNAAGEESNPLTEQQVQVLYREWRCEHNVIGFFTDFLFTDKRIKNIVFSRIIWAPPHAPPVYVYGNVHPDDLPDIKKKTRNLFPGLAHEAWTKPPVDSDVAYTIKKMFVHVCNNVGGSAEHGLFLLKLFRLYLTRPGQRRRRSVRCSRG